MRNLVWLLAAVLCVGSLRAETTATKPAPKAEKKTAEKYKESDAKSGLYIEPGVSALIFNGPKRESNIVSVTPPTFQRILQPSEEETVAPAYRLAVGYVFKDMPSWLGKGFRVEGSGNYWFTEAKSRQAVPNLPVVFAFQYDDSVPNAASDFAFVGLGGTPSSILRTSDNQFIDANLLFKTNYRLNRLIEFSPTLGFTYATLDHDASLVSTGGPEAYRLREHLDSMFYGGTAGLDVNFTPFEKFTFTVGGTVSPMASSTDGKMTSSWETSGAPGSGDRYQVKLDDDEIVLRATGTGSVKYQPLAWFSVTAFGGVEYWNKIAVVDFPTYRANVGPAPGSGFPKIGYNSMTNFRLGLNFTFTVGK
ncbi:MAG: hypothetical protein KIS92_21830 [Planctomycetota bacterium]|nr:hypothetical protein [Planctomycetota bacterium]